MKKLALIFFTLIYPLIVFANINECKTDVYFANGILTKESQAESNAKLLRTSIIEKFGINYYIQTIGKVDYAYNETHGGLSDGIETVYQKFGITGLSDLFGAFHGRDIDAQITAYKASINAGHKVLTVAHSQGNLFTYRLT
jgi:hypothetical protein